MSHSTNSLSSNVCVGGGAIILEGNNEGITQAAQQLKMGKLVAIPTETVYGLGANALIEESVREIFRVKGRPLTDPLIVHVPSISDALELVELEGFEKSLFEALGGAFWPGGLTLIAKQRSFLPLCLSAGTGYVGIRVPNHPLALQLLIEAGCPIAAPSANRFGHVSPTSHQHVFNDLGSHDIFILNGDEEDQTCKHGIESTVMKFDVENKELIIFRRGAVSQSQISNILQEMKQKQSENRRQVGEGGGDRGVLQECDSNKEWDSISDWNIRVITKHIPMPENYKHLNKKKMEEEESEHEVVVDSHGKEQGEEGGSIGEVAPGQLITHYAPDVPTFILKCHQENSIIDTTHNVGDDNGGVGAIETESREEEEIFDDDEKEKMMLDTVIIDFGGSLNWLSESCLAYHDMSTEGDVAKAGKTVFSALRWSESVIGAKRVLIADIESVISSDRSTATSSSGGCNETSIHFMGIEHAESVADRAFRAASGRVLTVRRGQYPDAIY